VVALHLAGAPASHELRITEQGDEPPGQHPLGTSRRDVQLGTLHDDVIEGRAGRDLLVGLAGSDLLDGGKDDDLVFGGNGDDRYLFTKGDGDDLIIESGGHDVLRFGAGIARHDVTVIRDRGDLVLKLRGHGGSVTVRDWFDASSSRVERVEFADGASWEEADLRREAKRHAWGGWSHDGRDGGWDDERHRHSRDEHGRDRHDGKWKGDEYGVRDSRELVAHRLDSAPRYDFDAVGDFLRRGVAHFDHSKTWGQVAGQWASIQRALGHLAQTHEDASHGAQDGPDRDHSLANSGQGWGHASSTGRRHAYAGLQSFTGLGEGFRNLG
jgi:hypothetical protein